MMIAGKNETPPMVQARMEHNQRRRQEWYTTTVAGKHHRGSLNLVSIYVDPWQEQL